MGNPAYSLLYNIIRIYEVILLARILMSWIRPDPYHPVVQWLRKLTDPVLEPVRRLLPLNAGGIDFSPMVVFIVLEVIERILRGQMMY
jgi:YggT family protein